MPTTTAAQLGYLRVLEGSRRSTPCAAPRLATTTPTSSPSLTPPIHRTLITGFDETSTGGTCFIPNPLVAALAERHPTRFIPFAGVDILRGAAGVCETREWIAARGFKGLSLRPFMIDLPPDDRRYYPFYELCVELDVPVSVRVRYKGRRRRHLPRRPAPPPMRGGRLSSGLGAVRHAAFLGLRDAAGAANHDRIRVPIPAPGTGWEPLLRFGQTTIQDKILYGSGAFLIGRQVRELLDEFRALPLRPAVMEKWLWRNAARLLGEPA